jgi:hypothetical protein
MKHFTTSVERLPRQVELPEVLDAAADATDPGASGPAPHGHQSKKRGPHGPCSDEELVGHIRRILTESPFHGEG